MNIEQVKEEAKKRFNKEITDEQAKAWLDAQPSGELQDEELENVAGGCGGDYDPMASFVGDCWKCGKRSYVEYARRSFYVFYKCSKCNAYAGFQNTGSVPIATFDRNGRLINGHGSSCGVEIPMP